MSIIETLKNPPIFSPAYNPIIWMVDSSETTQFKFRYVFDVYIQGQEEIRFKVPPNPKGVGIIDVSTLAAGSLSIPENLPFLSNLPFYTGDFLATQVYCFVGEEYATTIDGEAILHNGLGGTGAPAYGLFADGDFRPAPDSVTPVVAWASGQGAGESYDYYETGGENILKYEMDLPSPSPVEGRFLTRCPDNPQTIRSDEDFTLTWLNWNFEAESLNGNVPYTMRASFFNGSTYLGFEDYFNTVANGGTGWVDCSTFVVPLLQPNYTIPNAWWLESFKINPSDSFTAFRTQADLFPNWGASGGTLYSPFPQIFTGFGFDSGLEPPVAYTTEIFDDEFIETTNCLEPPGASGWSDLYYQPMDVPAGSVINFSLQSINGFGSDYPEMYLWGTTGDVDTASGYAAISAFTETNLNGDILYSISSLTLTANYTALGLRFQAIEGDECGYYGPFATPTSFVNISSPVVQDLTKICLDLHKYADFATCEVDPVPISETICLEIDDLNCWGFEPIRFTWLNNLGGRDWFTFMKRNTQVQNASRATMFRVPGYWSAATFSVDQVNPSAFGTTVYNIDLQNIGTASTDWITEEQSEWLRSMFASPSVFAFLPGRSQPTAVTITDANYAVETFARQKLFQYFVSFVEAQPDVVQQY